MTVLRSALLQGEEFEHGFGTKGSTPHDFPTYTHILLQVHGERIVVLTALQKTKGEGREESLATSFSDPGTWSPPREVVYRDLPPHPFRFAEGDALVTDIPGTALGIRTADCLPVLIADPITGAVAAVHCGWRSLALGLAGKGVRSLRALTGSPPGSFLAALGPCIGPCCFEVGREVEQSFREEKVGEGLFLLRQQSLYLDLAAGVKTQLLAEGMNPDSVEEISVCTKCNPDLFFSYRGGDEEDRMISFITARGAVPG